MYRACRLLVARIPSADAGTLITMIDANPVKTGDTRPL